MTRALSAQTNGREAARPLSFVGSVVFRKMCLARYFEQRVVEAFERKMIPGAIYLAIGQEAAPAAISELTAGFSVFNQHRCHAIYLAHGGDPETLRDELLGLPGGSCAGKGGCPSVYDPSVPTFPYHGFIGEQISFAVGYALASRRPTVVYFGDAAAEEDYALSAFGFAATQRVPLLFVCEDNDLSILTCKTERRSWDILDVIRSMGMPGVGIQDDPELIHTTVQDLLPRLPAFVAIKSCRHRWHSGIGVDGPPEWDRLAEMRETIVDANEIERRAKEEIDRLWMPSFDQGR